MMIMQRLRSVFCAVMFLALSFYLSSAGVIPPILVPVHAAPLFSTTLIVPTNNPVRVEYAKKITRNMVALGIDAKLVQLSFSDLANRLFFSGVPQGATYAAGGYDIGFIGWGYTNPIPDFASNLYGSSGSWAPNGNNYALYSNPQVNSLFDQFYGTTDTNQQISTLNQIQEKVFHDKPYNYIYEAAALLPREQKWLSWGKQNVSTVVTFPDIQQWSGGTELTLAEQNRALPDSGLNPAITNKANTFAAFYIYNPIMFSGAGLQDTDGRDQTFYPALATSISSTPDQLIWTINIRHGATFQSGVEITADDFVWTRWAMLNPATASVNHQTDVSALGNVVDFTFLNGTTVTLDNRASTSDPIRHGLWKATGEYQFQFHLPSVNAFTRQTYAAFAPLPKHILEKFPSNTWDTIPFSTAISPYLYTWDTGKYGGSGSYTAVGPVGAGPYYLQTYDFTNNIATLKKYAGYWNATGLGALGRFTVDTYKVQWISDKASAISALENGQVNVLEYNYQFNGNDATSLQNMGFNVNRSPSLGWQEQAFNLKHPVFGTGVATPLGQNDPSQAAEAARHVRTAISHLIPRNQITNDLLGGLGYPLASWVGPGWEQYYDSALVPDSYDLNAAAAELRAAGYQVASFVAEVPLVVGWNLISFPVVPAASSITAVLAQLPQGEVTVVWSYTGTGSSRSWMLYKPGTGGTLTTMVDGNGYWIFMSSADTLYILGDIIVPGSLPPAYSLVPGWNLVGFKPQPSIANETVHDYLSSISGKYDPNNVWVYNNTSTNWTRAQGSTWLVPNQALWVLVNSTITVTLRP